MIEVYFESTGGTPFNQVEPTNIVGLTRTYKPFTSSFSLGTTSSFCYEMDVIDYDGLNDYDFCEILKPVGNNSYRNVAKLFYDSITKKDNNVKHYVLTDAMTRFNATYNTTALVETSSLSDDNGKYITLRTLLNAIYAEAGVTEYQAPSLFDVSTIKLRDMGDVTMRDIISYVSELNGGFAFINEFGQVTYKQYTAQPTLTINANNCSSITIGETHTISKVTYDDGEVVASNGDNTGEVLFLNNNNVLLGELELTDGTTLTLQAIVDTIASVMLGYSYTSIESEMVEMDDFNVVSAMGTIEVVNGSNVYNAILTLDQSYNNGWYGGFKSTFESSTQQETQIVGDSDKMRKIVTKINRELNVISTEISEVVKVSDEEYQTLTTTIEKTIDGINVKASNSNTYVHIGNDVVEIINNGKRTQAMSDGQFISGEWVIGEMNNGKGLAIFRRGE